MSGEMPGGGIPVHVQGMAGMPAGMTSLQVHFFFPGQIIEHLIH